MTTKQPGDRRNGTALPEIREGITMNDYKLNDAELLATAREYVLELLFALDEKQVSHKPRPHAEIVELLHDLLELIDPANDSDHPGGTAA